MSQHARVRWPRLIITILAIVAVVGVATSANATSNQSNPGSLTIAFAAVPSSIDTAGWMGQASNSVFAIFGQGMTLVRYKPVGLPVRPPAIPRLAAATDVAPGLAKSWTLGRDGSIRMVLRPAVSGYGNVLKAADVKWTFDRSAAIDPITQFILGNASVNLKNPVSVINDSTIKINVTSVNPQTLVTFTSNFTRIYDSTEAKKHATTGDPWAKKWLNTHSADFSAWIVESFTPNSELRFKANSRYWGGTPKVQNVIIRAIPDPGSRVQLIKSGSVDVTDYLNFDQFASLGSARNVQRVSQPGVGYDVLNLDYGFKPFANRLVRRAVSMGIDRAALARGVYKGFGRPALDQLWNVPHPARPVDVSFKYNPVAAKALLARAGYPNGFKFTLLVSPSRPGPYSSQIGVFLQSQLKRIGINMAIRNIASAADYQELAASGKPDAFLYAAGAIYADPGFFMKVWHYSGPGGLQNYKGYKSPALNKLIDAMNKTPLGKKRTALVGQADAILNRDVAWVPLVQPTVPVAFSSRVDLGRFHIYPVGLNIEELALR